MIRKICQTWVHRNYGDHIIQGFKNQNLSINRLEFITSSDKTSVQKNSSDKISDFLKVLTYNAQNVDFITINVSSPNTVGLRNLQRFRDLDKLIQSIMQNEFVIAHKKPILIKVAPDLKNQELKSVVKVCKKYKISGIIATNTTIQRPPFKGSYQDKAGGLSGKPLEVKSNLLINKFDFFSFD